MKMWGIKPILSGESSRTSREQLNMSGRILLLFCVLLGVQSSPAPTLTLCKDDDSVCLTKTANVIYQLTIKGAPELNIEILDPMFQKEVIGDLTGLRYKLFNSTIIGSKNCEVVNMKLELQKSKLYLTLNCPRLAMDGHYEVTGQILSIPIAGNGEYRIKCKDYYVQIDTDIKISQRKDGKKYISFKSYKIDSDLQGGMNMNLTNLFNGKQKELAKSVLEFINKQWRPVVKELQAPVFNVNVKKLVLNFNRYLKSVPLEQILVNF